MALRMPWIPARNRTVLEYPIKAAEVWETGALLVLDATPELTECGADPAAVLGVSLGAAGDHVYPTQGSVAIAEEGSTFWAPGDNDPLITDVDTDYGVAVDGDGRWYVDGTDTSNLVVNVIGVDLTRNLYHVRFIASVRQGAP